MAGGLGTRLRPLTVGHPKHLLPVGGVPFLQHQIVKLAAAGVRRIVLATSYHAEAFEPVFGDGAGLGVRLVYVTEDEPLGTAGALANAATVLESGADDPVVALNGDVLSAHDLSAQLVRHRDHDADVTLHLVEVPDARAYGCVPTDSRGRVLAFHEKSPDPVSRQVNAGCYVFRRRLLDRIPTGRPVSVERETFPDLVRSGALVLGHVENTYWIDVGTPAALVRASADVVRGLAGAAAGTEHGRTGGQRWIAGSARVDPSAAVVGGSCVHDGAEVAAGALVDGSIVLPGAVVGPRASVVDSVLAADAAVGARTVLRDAVVGERAQIGSDCELIAGARVWCDVRLADGAVRFSPDR